MRCDGKVLGASVVPWTSDWKFDGDRFVRQVRNQIAAGFRDLYIFGTAGEGYAVTDSQFLEIVRVFSDTTRAAGIRPMVGIISLAQGTMIERIEAAGRLGVRRFQVSLPSWAPLSDDEIGRFFDDVLGGFPDFEFLHYNVARAKRQLTGEQYGQLAERHPNLVATKQSSDSMRQITSSMEAAPQVRHYFVDGGYALGSLIGDCGLLPSLATVNHERMHEFVSAGERRDTDELLRTQRELRHLVAGLRTVTGGRPLIDGAFDKLIWSLHDPGFPLRMLPPYTALDPADSIRLRNWITSTTPSWASPDWAT